MLRKEIISIIICTLIVSIIIININENSKDFDKKVMFSSNIDNIFFLKNSNSLEIDSVNVNIGNYDSPIADAGGPYNQIVGEPVTFDASGSYDPDGDIAGYRWDWTNDGSWDTCWLIYPTMAHTYYGEFYGYARLEVKDNDDLTDEDIAEVEISTVLKADAGGPYYGELNIPIQFYGNAYDGIPPYTYRWDFGDESSSNEQNPKYTYSENSPPEGYDVYLYVSDSQGDNDWDQTHAYVYGDIEEPTANANGPYSGFVNEEIQFIGIAYGGTPPYVYSWDFDDSDGIQIDSTDQNPFYIYETPGIYTVTFIVTDDNGKTDDNITTATIEEETIEDTIPPTVEIIKPVDGLYLGNKKILQLSTPLIIGKIDIEVEASDDDSGINKVEFYIENNLKETVDSVPYKWTWDTKAFFMQTIKVIVYDNADNSKTVEKMVWKFL